MISGYAKNGESGEAIKLFHMMPVDVVKPDEHAYSDGWLVEVVLHHLGAEDGNIVIAKDIRFGFALASLSPIFLLVFKHTIWCICILLLAFVSYKIHGSLRLSDFPRRLHL
ncbi:uncharacterized protein LOC131231628 [Magnolia sinica]|uniref:uncharacterized protein LOC131231628 n=1 Tax=Magnolia sinica TaxID=86752 RepID=UPI00265A2EC7|nr:uncharacterized protein LOC131231628 [Magnolia sinica]